MSHPLNRISVVIDQRRPDWRTIPCLEAQSGVLSFPRGAYSDICVRHVVYSDCCQAFREKLKAPKEKPPGEFLP